MFVWLLNVFSQKLQGYPKPTTRHLVPTLHKPHCGNEIMMNEKNDKRWRTSMILWYGIEIMISYWNISYNIFDTGELCDTYITLQSTPTVLVRLATNVWDADGQGLQHEWGGSRHCAQVHHSRGAALQNRCWNRRAFRDSHHPYSGLYLNPCPLIFRLGALYRNIGTNMEYSRMWTKHWHHLARQHAKLLGLFLWFLGNFIFRSSSTIHYFYFVVVY